MVISKTYNTSIWNICQKTKNTLEAAPHLGWKGSVVFFAAKYLEPHIREQTDKRVSVPLGETLHSNTPRCK